MSMANLPFCQRILGDGVLGIEDVLRRNFGSDWNPPMAGLDLAADY